MSEAMGYLSDVFAKSGGVGLMTALLFFACLGVALERVLFWRRLRADGSKAALTDVEALVRGGRFAEAGHCAGGSGDRLLATLGEALSKLRVPGAWPSVREAVLSEALGGGIVMGRRFLITAIQVFGLLGMLGTCKGLYAQLSGFGAVADAGAIQTAMGGMGEAFTTTLVGLTAAALATPLYVLNEAAIARFSRRLRYLDMRIQSALTEYAESKPGPAKAGAA
jgi:biopolymer transport protein ExbB/TolQ